MRHWYIRFLVEFPVGIFMMYLWDIIWTSGGIPLPSYFNSTKGFILNLIIGGLITQTKELTIKTNNPIGAKIMLIIK